MLKSLDGMNKLYDSCINLISKDNKIRRLPNKLKICKHRKMK